jgi:CRP-like cAMP-binding protein/membrane protease YdiL (CAAX protease family)
MSDERMPLADVEETSSPTDETLTSTSLFSGLSPQQLAKLDGVCHDRYYAPGAFILREGDTDPFVYVIMEGHAELAKSSNLGEELLRMGTFRKGDVLGELKIVDAQPSSASVVAVTRVRALAIDLDAFHQASVLTAARATVLGNVGKILADRLRRTTRKGADAIDRELAETRARVYAGRFIVIILAMIATYQLALSGLLLVPPVHRPPLSILSFIFVLWTVGPVLLCLRRSPFSLRSYGLTLDKAGSTALRAALWTTPLLMVSLGIKVALIRWGPAMTDRPLFDPTALFGGRPFNLEFFLLAMILYCLHAPLQEFVVRVGLQGSLEHFLPAGCQRTNWKAIVISNLVFASGHAFLGFWFCIVVFVPGLFWGWLFSRQRSLVGVAVSHALLGLWSIFALGIHALVESG